MNFVCYDDWHQLPDSAGALFSKSANDSVFSSRTWLEGVAGHVTGEDQTLVLACVVSADKVLAILPLVRSTANIWASLRHRYTPHYRLLLANEDRAQVLACLARGLNQLPLQALLFEPLIDDDSIIDELQRSMESAGFCSERIFRHYNWIYRVQGRSYQAYMAERPARLRNTLARKMRKLEREHGYDVRLFKSDEAPRAMSDYYAVYRASWKANEQYTGFMDEIVAGFSGAGWIRLAVLYIKGQPAAAQLWFVHHGRASIFRLSYDEKWKQYSPGSILTSRLMEHVIETDKVSEIDFLTGNEAYKQDWMSERRECFALSCIKAKAAEPASRYMPVVESIKRIFNRR